MTRLIIALLVFGACNLDSSLDAPTPDTQQDAPIDAAPRCNPGAAFDDPVPVGVVNSVGVDADAWFSLDALTIYFRSNRSGGPGEDDLFRATRSASDAEFEPPTVLPNVNSTGFENGAVVTDSGLSLFLGSTREAPGHDIFIATRTDVGNEFGVPELLLNVNDVGSNNIPSYINSAETNLYFSSDRNGANDLFLATRSTPQMAFEAPVELTELNGSTTDTSAVLTADELTVFFLSDRPNGLGGADIWAAKRSTVSAQFGEPMNIGEINTTANEQPTWVSPDGCELLLHSDRAGGVGVVDLWLARRPL